MGSDLAPPTAVFHDRERSLRSVIEGDGEFRGELATKLRNCVYQVFADSVFDRTRNEYAKIEANALKRGPKDVSFCKLELKPGSQPRACNPIQAVGIKEEEMKKTIKGFPDKGWIVRPHSARVARGFLVPKPGTNKWRLVIDYRYLNSCLEGHEFPLPVIEDLLQGQARTHLWTILDLEDGFQQMPLLEECRHLTAFCTPARTFEWKVLPMRVKVGPEAFQRLVSWCVGRLKPHIRAYIDDILVGTRPTCSGKRKLLDSQAILEHYKFVRELFEVLKECHLQVKTEKCFLFYTQVKYVGHILHEGQRSPAPGKVAAVREWSEDMIRTPKQMKTFPGICNWHSVYIPNYASLAAPHMDSLAGKYKYDPVKRTSKVAAHKQTIGWTYLMREYFQKIMTSLCEACSLYIPTDQGEFAIHMDAPYHGIGAFLEQRDGQGN